MVSGEGCRVALGPGVLVRPALSASGKNVRRVARQGRAAEDGALRGTEGAMGEVSLAGGCLDRLATTRTQVFVGS